MDTNITNNLYYENISSNTNSKGVFIISHGMAEHIGRYNWLISKLNNDGYHVISQDHRGHGKWIKNGHPKGIFANFNGWEVITQDLNDLINNTNKKYPDLNIKWFSNNFEKGDVVSHWNFLYYMAVKNHCKYTLLIGDDIIYPNNK